MHPAEKELLMETVRNRGVCLVRVGGYCMRPAIRSGALITIEQAVPESLRPGDVLAFFLDSRLFAHRLVAHQAGKFVLRSDSGRPDIHEVAEGNILGKVTKVANPSLWSRIIFKMQNSFVKPFTVLAGGNHG